MFQLSGTLQMNLGDAEVTLHMQGSDLFLETDDVVEESSQDWADDDDPCVTGRLLGVPHVELAGGTETARIFKALLKG